MAKRLKRTLELPLDIAYSVLLRVPMKTLCNLRAVSKSWCSLISDPFFQKDHIQHNSLLLVISSNRNDDENLLGRFTTYNNKGTLIREFFKTHNNEGSIEIEFPTKRLSGFFPIQSCRGLVCLKVRYVYGWSILLCNPFTEEMITLPEQLQDQFHVCAGFGYAASTGKFKVFRFFLDLDTYNEEELNFEGEKCYCEVFTLGISHQWREARSPPYVPLFGAHLPFLHGALHLLPDEESHPDGHKYIAAFDVDTEEYKEIPLPEIYFNQMRSLEKSSQLKMAELRGSLCLTFDFFDTKKMLELWFLKDYHGGTWVKQYKIDLSSTNSFLFAFPIAIMDDYSILLKVDTKDESKLCSYNTRANHFAETKGINCEAMFYVESSLQLETRQSSFECNT